ncbi:uncharacterized protein LOC132704617 [Cylas formicarius]|uniref:uncharacterized protein LOC132704617 n=1 Tax=Cylas formicarius TaxID=197179 RepID=UPI00295831E0|nr:uncharacterized protein LOC132704617 [Cylas formicarius]
MLATLVSVVNCTQAFVWGVIYYSCQTGHVLVTVIRTIFEFVWAYINGLQRCLCVFGESLSIFGLDILQILQSLFFGVTSVTELVCGTVIAVYLKIAWFFTECARSLALIYSTITNVILVFWNTVMQLIVLTKKLILLCGSGAWFAVTLLPFFFIYLCSLFAQFMSGLIIETYEIIIYIAISVKNVSLDTIKFLLDVPLESLAGLFVILSISYVFAQFYTITSRWLKLLLGKLKGWLRRTITLRITARHEQIYGRSTTIEIERRRARVGRPLERLRNRQAHVAEKSELADERACVICQERSKCVLLLPCRHLCLCTECQSELRYYNDLCPICRTHIDRSLKVFV